MSEPQSMVERVARAIGVGLAANRGVVRSIYHDLTPNERKALLPLARHAIGAMREPSEAMIATADDAYDQCTDTGDFYGFIWRAMIDAALAEQSPAENGPVRGEGA
jgi:hypothetical protein